MEKVITELIGASPVAVALLVAMWVFVRFLQGERETRAQQMKQCHEAHAAVLSESSQTARECRDAIRECARSHGQVAEALREMRRSA